MTFLKKPVVCSIKVSLGPIIFSAKTGTNLIGSKPVFLLIADSTHGFILVEEITHEIYKTEKQAFGKVIRMMSHEINNSIAAVNSVLHTIRPKLEKHEGYTQAVDVCISRNENLNRFMCNFADVVRIPEPNLKSVDLNILAGNTLLLFQKQHHSCPISFSSSMNKSPIMINADDSQIEQVLMNILKNACEAIENEGKIEVITRCNPATLIVRNNGRGIENVQREQLFTPVLFHQIARTRDRTYPFERNTNEPQMPV